jgi:hypothetical protein
VNEQSRGSAEEAREAGLTDLEDIELILAGEMLREKDQSEMDE